MASKRNKQKHGAKSEKIRKLLGSGLSGPAIAEKVGCTAGLVYAVKARMEEGGSRISGGKKKGPGRPKREPSSLNDLVAHVQQLQKERDDAVAAVDRIRELLP